MGGWAVALIIRIKGVTRPNIGVVYFVLCLCWCAVIVQESEVLKMLKDQWNVIVYYSHPLVCDAIGCTHPAHFMPKGEWFCGVLCILGMPPHWSQASARWCNSGELAPTLLEVLALLCDNCALASQALAGASCYSWRCSMKLWWAVEAKQWSPHACLNIWLSILSSILCHVGGHLNDTPLSTLSWLDTMPVDPGKSLTSNHGGRSHQHMRLQYTIKPSKSSASLII